MEDCCDPAHLFAMTKMNSPMGKSMWYDGEFLYSFTIDNSTYSLFPQATPFQLPLKKCAVVGNGGILKKSGCGRHIDEADFVMRCNLPPLSSEYTKDVGSKSHLVTANPSIIRQSYPLGVKYPDIADSGACHLMKSWPSEQHWCVTL
nr:PREDICTED: alpha-N-acetylneuraminide alpha-2,8-sialyltransferase-like [Equus przewalskii]